MATDFVRYANQLQLDVDDSEWENSPFLWIKNCPSRTKGKIGELLIEQFCTEQGMTVGKSPDSEADRIIDGIRKEIKTSTKWSSGCFKFQQLRKQNYKTVILLGIYPQGIRVWELTKEKALKHASGQHTGKDGTETYWIGVDSQDIPDWLQEDEVYSEFYE